MALHLLPRVLKYLDLVSRLGSIQAASRECGIAASAIDRQILQIEQACETQLFERQPTGMKLTPAGEAVIALARRWRADESGIWSELKRMQGVEVGHARLAAMDSQANGVLPELIDRMRRAHPRVSLDIEIMTPDEASRAVEDGAADLALAFNLKPRRALHILWSAELPFGCVAAPYHPLCREASPTLRDVARHSLIAQSASLSIRQYLDRRHGWLFGEDGPAVVTNSLQLVKQAAIRGGHVAMTSELDAAHEILNGQLRFIPLAHDGIAPQSISVAINAGRPFSAVARLVADETVAVVQKTLRLVEEKRDT
jgi:DNA-binding transcriptional LysR family regulator